MSWIRIARVVGGVIVTGGVLIGGKIWGQTSERQAHEPMRKENEKLRTEYAELIGFFESRSYKYEAIIAQIYQSHPASKAELKKLLQSHGLSEKEIDRVHSILAESNFYNERAA